MTGRKIFRMPWLPCAQICLCRLCLVYQTSPLCHSVFQRAVRLQQRSYGILQLDLIRPNSCSSGLGRLKLSWIDLGYLSRSAFPSFSKSCPSFLQKDSSSELNSSRLNEFDWDQFESSVYFLGKEHFRLAQAQLTDAVFLYQAWWSSSLLVFCWLLQLASLAQPNFPQRMDEPLLGL